MDWRGWDGVGIAAGVLLTVAITVVLSRGRIFWEDEMLGWMLLRDPSWRHMLFAYNQGADGGGFSFYLLGRAWFDVFGPSALAFRLFSATCFGLALAVTWATLRRFYGVGVTAFATLNTWFFSPPFVAHMAEGRFYGLLVLGVTLAARLTAIWGGRSLQGERPLSALCLGKDAGPSSARASGTRSLSKAGRSSWLPYLAMFLVHGLLVTSHLLGMVFSAFLIGAMAVLDALEHRLKRWLYVAGLASWLLLLPERANILASSRVGKPWFWTKAPRVMEIFSVYTGSSKEIALVLLALLGAAFWAGSRRSGGLRGAAREAWERRRPVWVVVGALWLLGVAMLGEGLVGTWLFNDRYLLPLTVGVAYLTAELIQIVFSAAPTLASAVRAAPMLRFGTGVAFGAALLFWDFRHLAKFSPSPEDYTGALTARLPRGVPVVCEDAFSFTDLLGRQHDSGVRYVYLLDWQQTVSASAPRLEVTQYHLMENWRRVGYFSGSIEPATQFLREHRRFFVVHAEPQPPTGLPPEIGNPLAQRLGRDPAYEVRLFTTLNRAKFRDDVFLVCRGGCGKVR